MEKLVVGELFRVFEVNYNEKIYEVFTSVGGGIGLIFNKKNEGKKFIFYTGVNKNQEFDIYPNCSNDYTVLEYNIDKIESSSVFLDDKLSKVIDQKQSFYIRKSLKGIIEINDHELLQLVKEVYSKLPKNSNISDIKIQVPHKILKFGTVFTDKKYYSNPSIAREKEIELVELGLLTPKKSPLLVGPPGVGKTAIAEGLAYRIQTGDVPLALQNKIIFNLEPMALISGCENVGMVEKNMEKIITSIKDREDIILFIDEFHTLIGLGLGGKGNLDVANMLKPYLASGEIKIIGSTTFEEYNNILLKDKAFARRFKLVNVCEPKLEDVIQILFGSICYYEQVTGVKFVFSEEEKQTIFKCMAYLTEQNNRIQNKYYPDITLEILADSFGLARLQSRDVVTIEDIANAISISNTVNEQAKEETIDILNNSFPQNVLKLKM